VRSKVFTELCLGFLGTLAAALVSADTVTEYTSLASWNAEVSDVSVYNFSGAPGGYLAAFDGVTGVTFGPGTFTTPGNLGLIFNDGLFGNGVQYVAASPGAFEGSLPAVVDVSFNTSADVTALAFTLGSEKVSSDINISVNGSSIDPLVVSTAFPTAFLGVTDTSGPITNIAFTVSNFNFPGPPGTEQEMDVINSYATARAVATAPEIDAVSAASAITLLFGSLAMLCGRKRA
jgi:hypothetical protein